MIVYLYNPFDEVIIRQVFEKIRNRNVYVIYNAPFHADCFDELGYQRIYEHKGFHANVHTMIFKRAG